jgi:hypothetical protein
MAEAQSSATHQSQANRCTITRFPSDNALVNQFSKPEDFVDVKSAGYQLLRAIVQWTAVVKEN